jgi:hypothetical protein
MDHDHPHENHTAHPESPSGQTYFSDAEWKELRAQDLYAAQHVVALMFSIFVVGLLLYTGVALVVGNIPA